MKKEKSKSVVPLPVKFNPYYHQSEHNTERQDRNSQPSIMEQSSKKWMSISNELDYTNTSIEEPQPYQSS